MRKIKIRELSLEAFRPYGSFADVIKPQLYTFGEPPVQFCRDMLQANLGEGAVSFSANIIGRRPFVITRTECHSRTGEALMPLDSDIVIHCGPATRNGVVPLDQFEAFRVPKGTMVALKPGTWHHAPFAWKSKLVHVLVVLPERTYANDCFVYEIPEQDRLQIVAR